MYPGTRLLVHDGERTLSERTARRKYDTSSAAALEGLGLTVERVPRRGRYFAFRGRRSEQKMLRAAIADRERPYPKRQSGVVIKLAGGRSDQKHIGFVRVRRRTLKGGSSATTFDLLRSVRVDGAPRHQFVLTSARSAAIVTLPVFGRAPAPAWPRTACRRSNGSASSTK
jgi:hypothetical protein